MAEDPDCRHTGVDLVLGSAHQGRGLGPEAIALVARYSFEVRGHHRLTIDPAAGNVQAIRAYERVGFAPVGVMRKYERGHDGAWHDGLLMDLLSAGLREPGPADRSRETRPAGYPAAILSRPNAAPCGSPTIANRPPG